MLFAVDLVFLRKPRGVSDVNSRAMLLTSRSAKGPPFADHLALPYFVKNNILTLKQNKWNYSRGNHPTVLELQRNLQSKLFSEL